MQEMIIILKNKYVRMIYIYKKEERERKKKRARRKKKTTMEGENFDFISRKKKLS